MAPIRLPPKPEQTNMSAGARSRRNPGRPSAAAAVGFYGFRGSPGLSRRLRQQEATSAGGSVSTRTLELSARSRSDAVVSVKQQKETEVARRRQKPGPDPEDRLQGQSLTLVPPVPRQHVREIRLRSAPAGENRS